MSQPRPNNGRIIVLMNPLYPLGNQLLQYIIKNEKLTASNVDCYMYKPTDDVLTVFRNMYNRGYRFFIGPQNSATLESLTTFFTNRQDAIYINSSSTVYQLNMPPNIIRSSVNDYTLCEYINNYFLLHISELLQVSENKTMYEPLSTTPAGQPAFKRMVYIYQESNYTKEFLQMLEQTQDPSLNVPIIPYLIKLEDVEFSQELIDLLAENPVSSPDYKDSDKTLFIVNSSTPQDMLYFFNELKLYDNYFYFCDPFFSDLLETSYQLRYSFFGAGNYSTVGYKLSQQVDPNQDISPVALGIVDLALQLGQWYMNNRKGSTMKQLIEKLKNIDYLYNGNDNNWYWYVRQIYIYNARYPTISDESADYKMYKDPLVFKSTASPSQNGGVSNQEKLGTQNFIGNSRLTRILDSVPPNNYIGWVRARNWYCRYTKHKRPDREHPKEAYVRIAKNYAREIVGYQFPLADSALVVSGGDTITNHGTGNIYGEGWINLNWLLSNKFAGKKFLFSFFGCPRARGRKDTTITIKLNAIYGQAVTLHTFCKNYEVPSTSSEPPIWTQSKFYFNMPFINKTLPGETFNILGLELEIIGEAKDKDWTTLLYDLSLVEVISE